MKSGRSSAPILLDLFYFSLLPALLAQGISVLPEVIGYLGDDVTLPCTFISTIVNHSLTQVQWDLLGPEGKKVNVLVFNHKYGLHLFDSPLKEKVKLERESLVITDVEMQNEGEYTCTLSSFPAGSFDGTTRLIVREEQLLTSGMVAAIVVAVLLLLAIMAAVVYFFFIKRSPPSVRHQVFIGGAGSVTERSEPDVVYCDVKFSKETTSNNIKHGMPSDGDVTYADVAVLGPKPK